jgi:hypothetical protein
MSKNNKYNFIKDSCIELLNVGIEGLVTIGLLYLTSCALKRVEIVNFIPCTLLQFSANEYSKNQEIIK